MPVPAFSAMMAVLTIIIRAFRFAPGRDDMTHTQTGKDLKTPELLLFAWADVFGGGGQSILSVLYLVF